MKIHTKFFLMLIFSISSVYLFGQQDCKVLKSEITGSYKGRCKKGLANGKGKAVGTDNYEGIFKNGLPHGKGKYTNSIGEVYEGDWKKGLRHGEGRFSFNAEGKDSTITGIWEKNVYIGPIRVNPYKILRKISVDRYSINRIHDGNQVLISIYQNGAINTNIEDLTIIANKGMEISFGNSIGYEHIKFPFFCKINYRTWNKFHTAHNNVIFEFEITQPGNWKVVIHN